MVPRSWGTPVFATALSSSRRLQSTVARSPGAMSLLSWNVDMSERSAHGQPRRMPRALRIAEVVRFIRSVSADVVCLQDSSLELGAALCSPTAAAAVDEGADPVPAYTPSTSSSSGASSGEFRLVASARNGNTGWLQTFVAVGSHLEATSEPTQAFCTVSVSSPSRRPLRITNFDLAYKGKALQVEGSSGGDGLNVGAFSGSYQRRAAGVLDPHRAMAVHLLVNVVQPDIAVGCTYMGATETLHQPLYSDAWASAGADPDHELTLNTLPIFAPADPLITKMPEQQFLTNYYYFSEPHATEKYLARPGSTVRRRAASTPLTLWSPPGATGSACNPQQDGDGSMAQTCRLSDEPTSLGPVTTNAGRYQRTFLRKSRHHGDGVLQRFHTPSFVVLHPWVHWGGLPMCPTMQFPTLLLLS